MLERISGYKTECIQHDDRAKRNIIKELLIAKYIIVQGLGKNFVNTTG
jgi:hypothetical protein